MPLLCLAQYDSRPERVKSYLEPLQEVSRTFLTKIDRARVDLRELEKNIAGVTIRFLSVERHSLSAE